MGLYLLWLMYLLCRILGQWSSLTYMMKRWTHLFALTLLVVVFTTFCVGFFLYGRYSGVHARAFFLGGFVCQTFSPRIAVV